MTAVMLGRMLEGRENLNVDWSKGGILNG